MTTHTLKSWPCFFDQIACGRKLFDLRREDRHFKIGDTVILLEYVYDARTDAERKAEKDIYGRYTGRALAMQITYITRKEGGDACAYSNEALTEGYCILSYTPL